MIPSQENLLRVVVTLAAATVALLALTACDTSSPPADTSESPDEDEPAATAQTPALPSLQDKLDARNADFQETASPQLKQTFAEGVTAVGDSGVMETALRVGDPAPDFTLPNAKGRDVTLSALLADGPVVLTWYRGGWCPYCNIQLAAYRDALPAIEAAGGQLVAISPELPDKAADTVDAQNLDFTVLSDVGNAVAGEYGIAYRLPDPLIEAFTGRLDLPAYNGDESWSLPLAVTYVVDRDGVIRYAFVDEDYKKRAEPADIVAALQALEP